MDKPDCLKVCISGSNEHTDMSSHESMSFRESIDRMVDRASLAIGFNPETAKVIQSCNAVIQLKFPVCIGSKVEVFTGW